MMPTHRCAATDCRSICNSRYLMCGRHWRMVPAELQHAVHETFAKRKRRKLDASAAPWWRAQARAVYAVAVLERKSDADAKLARDLAFADRLEGVEQIAEQGHV